MLVFTNRYNSSNWSYSIAIHLTTAHHSKNTVNNVRDFGKVDIITCGWKMKILYLFTNWKVRLQQVKYIIMDIVYLYYIWNPESSWAYAYSPNLSQGNSKWEYWPVSPLQYSSESQASKILNAQSTFPS